MKRKMIGILILGVFISSATFDTAYAVEVNSQDTVYKCSLAADEDQKQLLIDSLEGADFDKIEYYLALFGKYSSEDANSLTAEEILDYIDLYGSYTGKDIISETGMQKVVDNLESYKDVTGFEDILYDAETYYGMDEEETGTTDETINAATITPANPMDSHKDGNQMQKPNYLGYMVHKNWNDKKLDFTKFTFDTSIINSFVDFFQKCFEEYLNGTLNTQDILSYIQSQDYSQIESILQGAVTNGNGKNQKNDKATNAPGSMNRPISNPNMTSDTMNNQLDKVLDGLNQNGAINTDTIAKQEESILSGSKVSNTADPVGLFAIIAASVGSLFGLRKTFKKK